MEVSCAAWNLRAISLWIVMADLDVIMLDQYFNRNIFSLNCNRCRYFLTINQFPTGWHGTLDWFYFCCLTSNDLIANYLIIFINIVNRLAAINCLIVNFNR